MYKQFLSITVLVILFSTTLTAFAQDDGLSADEVELIAYVQSAYENLLEVDTYRTSGKQTITQTISLSGVTVDQDITQNMETQVRTDEQGTDSYAYVEQSTTSTSPQTGSTSLALTLETILIDGEFYLRYTGLDETTASLLPKGWAKAEDVPGMEMLNLDALAELNGTDQLQLFQLAEEKVASIIELDPQEIEGISVRVFQIVWQQDAFNDIAGGNLMDMSSLGVDTEQFLLDLYTSSVYEQILMINAETNLPYRVEFQMVTENLDLSVQGMTMTLSQTSVNTTTLSGFNEPVEIEVPTLGE